MDDVMRLYHYDDAERMIREMSSAPSSIADVGCGPTTFLNRFPDIVRRTAMDRKSYAVWANLDPGVRRIVGQFPDTGIHKHDVVVSLQVLEHVIDQWHFCQQLMSAAEQLVVLSIPYQWQNAGWHSDYGEAHLRRWFGRDPDRMVVSKCQRLVAAYRSG